MNKTEKNKITQKVQTLVQALPYIQQFREKVFVIKYGGSAMSDKALKEQTIKDFVLLNCVGIKTIIVHGGGPEINSMSEKLSLPIKFVDGHRVTDAKTMEIVEMVLVGKVQRELVNLVNVLGGKGIGLSGKDGKLFSVKANTKKKKLGFVGDIVNVDANILMTLLDKGFIPIISSVGADSKGQNYNINADSVACSIAASLNASKLILMTDTPGVLKNQNNPDSLISKLSVSQANKMLASKKIKGGMIPKVKCAVKAVKDSVKSVQIIDGRQKHSILLELFTDTGFGTMIVK